MDQSQIDEMLVKGQRVSTDIQGGSEVPQSANYNFMNPRNKKRKLLSARHKKEAPQSHTTNQLMVKATPIEGTP